jgi:hypothetical protein
MTVVAPEAPKLHILAVYKPGHELAGMTVERGRECGCGRWFTQNVISQKWLAQMSDGKRAYFLESCEIQDYKKGPAAWFPQKCWKCLRRLL